MNQPLALLSENKLLGNLRAEDEQRTDLFFVPPAEFLRVAGDGSVLVFGDAGSGKTTLYKALQTLARGTEFTSARLLVFWRPVPVPDGMENAAAVKRLAGQVLDACAMALLAHIAQAPAAFEQLPQWTKEQLVWFVKRCLLGNPAARLGPFTESFVPGHTSIETFLTLQVEDILYDPSPEQMVTALVSGLKRMGLAGLWVLSDGLESWADVDPQQLGRNLTSFLSALSLFEHSGLAFKFFIPVHLEPDVMRASGLLRRRVDAYRLDWDTARLRAILEKRLAFMFQREVFVLQDLCSSPSLLSWLQRAGGGSPREWLEQIRPLVDHFSGTAASAPLDEKVWKELRIRHTPYFWMDESGHKIKVGGREIPLDDVPPKAYDMLRYLYRHAGQVVTKDELYYLVYLGLEAVPHSPHEPGYETPSVYAGLIDTSIYRLRQAIEPDPDEPVLLQTVRGHGVKLVSRS